MFQAEIERKAANSNNLFPLGMMQADMRREAADGGHFYRKCAARFSVILEFSAASAVLFGSRVPGRIISSLETYRLAHNVSSKFCKRRCYRECNAE